MVYVFDGQIFWRFKKQPTWLESELSSDFLLVHGTTESPVHLRHITNKLKITISSKLLQYRKIHLKNCKFNELPDILV